MALSGVYDMFNEAWKEYQTIYIISDTHFGEDDLKRAFPNRPSDDELVRRINAKVGKKDLLIHLGDVGDLEYMKKIRGHKILIAGNHDCGMEKYKEVFDQVFSGALIIGEKLILSHEPIAMIPWAFNFHGHNHAQKKNAPNHMNVCADVLGYEPAHLNSLLNGGIASKVYTIHRETIDGATERKRKRGGKKVGEK
jgi:calcineurin-like phosphoesterase family protein